MIKNKEKKFNNEKILTISVAAYNLENQIEKNLESFCNSDVIDDLEVIITDDESTDKTVSIVEKYVKKYPRSVCLIKQKNHGPGSTVNSGIKHATGKYFKMVDGDDWVDTENLNKMVKFLKHLDVDMVINDYNIYSDKDNRIIDTVNFPIKSNLICNFGELNYYVDFAMHSVTYKTKILKDNNIVLDDRFYTDTEYLLFPIPFIKNYIYLDYPIYIYRIARIGQSVSISSLKKNIKMHELVLKHLLNYYNNHNFALNYGQQVFMSTRIANMADMHLCILLSLPNGKIETKHFINYLKNNNKQVYDIFKQAKKVKLLIYSFYLSYPIVKKILIKKNKW